MCVTRRTSSWFRTTMASEFVLTLCRDNDMHKRETNVDNIVSGSVVILVVFRSRSNFILFLRVVLVFSFLLARLPRSVAFSFAHVFCFHLRRILCFVECSVMINTECILSAAFFVAVYVWFRCVVSSFGRFMFFTLLPWLQQYFSLLLFPFSMYMKCVFVCSFSVDELSLSFISSLLTCSFGPKIRLFYFFLVPGTVSRLKQHKQNEWKKKSVL